MSQEEATLEGTLNPDGTLELDHPPNVEPGRVQIIVKRLPPSPSGGGVAAVLAEIHQGQKDRGFQGRSAQEIDAGLREGEETYEQKMQALRSCIESGPLAGGS